MKICTKCKIEKELDHFGKDKQKPDGLCLICDDCVKIKNKESYRKRKLGINKRVKKTQKEKTERYRLWQKNRKENDPLFKFDRGVRKLIYMSLYNKNHRKTSRTQEILGCSVNDFKKYIESKWKPWMNWSNYGKYNGHFEFGWDLDHIVPVSSAKLESDIIKLNHYSNLQPLCSKVNRFIKSNSLE